MNLRNEKADIINTINVNKQLLIDSIKYTRNELLDVKSPIHKQLSVENIDNEHVIKISEVMIKSVQQIFKIVKGIVKEDKNYTLIQQLTSLVYSSRFNMFFNISPVFLLIDNTTEVEANQINDALGKDYLIKNIITLQQMILQVFVTLVIDDRDLREKLSCMNTDEVIKDGETILKFISDMSNIYISYYNSYNEQKNLNAISYSNFFNFMSNINNIHNLKVENYLDYITFEELIA